MENRSKVMEQLNQYKLYYANPHPKTHAIIAAMLQQEPRTLQKFVGKAIVTSDGFVQCNFVGADGVAHHSAFVGSAEEVERNVHAVADELGIPAEQTDALLQEWYVIDYRH